MAAWTALGEGAHDLAKRILPGDPNPTVAMVVAAAVKQGLMESSECLATAALTESVERLSADESQPSAELTDSMLRTIVRLRRLITELAYD
jgi:hypothetical protein